MSPKNNGAITKDALIKVLGGIVGAIAFGYFSWLGITTVQNTNALSELSDVKTLREEVTKGRTCLWRHVSRNKSRLNGRIFGPDPAPARCDN